MAEAARLSPFLSNTNLSPFGLGKILRRDMPAFKEQLKNSLKGYDATIKQNAKDIESLKSTGNFSETKHASRKEWLDDPANKDDPMYETLLQAEIEEETNRVGAK